MLYRLRTLMIVLVLAAPALSWDIRYRIELPPRSPPPPPPQPVEAVPSPGGYPPQPEYDDGIAVLAPAPAPDSEPAPQLPRKVPHAEQPIAHFTINNVLWVMAVVTVLAAVVWLEKLTRGSRYAWGLRLLSICKAGSRSFRFTLRDLLWLTLAVAMGCGWWNAERHIADVKAEFKSLYSDQFNSIAKFRNDMAEKGLVIESDGDRVSIRATK